MDMWGVIISHIGCTFLVDCPTQPKWKKNIWIWIWMCECQATGNVLPQLSGTRSSLGSAPLRRHISWRQLPLSGHRQTNCPHFLGQFRISQTIVVVRRRFPCDYDAPAAWGLWLRCNSANREETPSSVTIPLLLPVRARCRTTAHNLPFNRSDTTRGDRETSSPAGGDGFLVFGLPAHSFTGIVCVLCVLKFLDSAASLLTLFYEEVSP